MKGRTLVVWKMTVAAREAVCVVENGRVKNTALRFHLVTLTIRDPLFPLVITPTRSGVPSD